MLVKSEAILLRKTPYSDNSAILHMFTRTHGLQSFITQGLHGKSGKAALYQPGNLLELVFYFQSNKNLKRIKEVQLMQGFRGYDPHPVRLQILLFCLELSSKCLPEEQEDPATFAFLKTRMLSLAETDSFTWFPLDFLLHFAQICGLGLQFQAGDESGMYLETGYTQLQSNRLHPMQHLDEKEILACKNLLGEKPAALTFAERRLLTEKLLQYFRMHLFPDKEMKSFPVLMEVLG